jgi:hypothetical protein
MAAVVRVLEVIVGLALGCLGLFVSVATVIAGVAACQRMFDGQSPSEPDLGVLGGAVVGALMLLGARKMLRGPGSASRPRVAARWIAVCSCGGLLALLLAVVIPNFLRFSKRAISSEPRLVLGEIKTAEESYFGEFGEYLSFDAIPGGPPSATPVAEIQYPDAQAHVFEALGWSFERGPVYCRYAVAVGSPGVSGGGAQAFTAEAICDIDGDGIEMAWGYVRPDRESGAVIPGPFDRCPPEGAIDRSTGRRMPLLVGPCDTRSGRNVF